MTEQTTTGIQSETLSEKFLASLKKTWENFEGTITLADKIGASLKIFSQITEDCAKSIIEEKLNQLGEDSEASASSICFKLKSEFHEGLKTATLSLVFTSVSGGWIKAGNEKPTVVIDEDYDLNPSILTAVLDSKDKLISFSSKGRGITALQQAEFSDENFDTRMLECFEETIFPWVNGRIKFADAKDYMRVLSAPAETSTPPAP